MVYPQIPDEIKSCEARKHDKEFIHSIIYIKQNKEARKRNGWKRILSATLTQDLGKGSHFELIRDLFRACAVAKWSGTDNSNPILGTEDLEPPLFIYFILFSLIIIYFIL